MIIYCMGTIYTNFKVLRHHQGSGDVIMSLENEYTIKMGFGIKLRFQQDFKSVFLKWNVGRKKVNLHKKFQRK